MVFKYIQYYFLIISLLFLSSCNDKGQLPIYGCLDPNSENYCDYCTVHDNSCDCGIENDNYTYRFNDIVNIFSSYECSGCHFSSNGSIYGGLDLESYASVKQRVSSCGSIETSKLLIEITTGSMASYADSDLIQILEVWISEGAPE